MWVGTEDTGLWCYDRSKAEGQQWKQFLRTSTGGEPDRRDVPLATHTPSEFSLGDDNAYALACDKQGRIWVGHLNHGVSVYDGRDLDARPESITVGGNRKIDFRGWRNYDVLTGPLGERVYAISVCPVDGDVWIAGSSGLARYRVDKNTWTYYTRADGLPSDNVNCVAFDKAGTIYVGTHCDGLAVCSASRVSGTLEYGSWNNVVAQVTFGSRPPYAPIGEGLPSSLINDVLVAHDGRVYVATTMGLAVSKDKGHSWKFIRGQNWREKLSGARSNRLGKEVFELGDKLANGRTLLTEDYVTCLAEDDAGNLWIGHRQMGCEIINPRVGSRVTPGQVTQLEMGSSAINKCEHATAFCSHGGEVIAGFYGAGLVYVRKPEASVGPKASDASKTSAVEKAATSLGRGPKEKVATVAPLPVPAARPTPTALATMLTASVKAKRPWPKKLPLVVALNDDWRTQGDWLGRYGRYWACLAAICSPRNYLWGAGWEPVKYYAQIGPHCDKGDSLRHWVHWLYTDNPRCLEMPPIYLHSRIVKGLTNWDKPRRQAEWDDHGEAYPMAHEGPDVYCTLDIPAGLYVMSLYDMNKDGHSPPNTCRDYYVSIRAHDPKARMGSLDGFEQQPELAHARIYQFWGGVWKRFLVRGPTQITVKVGRNYSFNTIWAGIMLDLVTRSRHRTSCRLKTGRQTLPARRRS